MNTYLKNKYREQYRKYPQGAAKYIWQYSNLKKRWKRFLIQFNHERILDFGSGAGIALKVGNDLGLNITGLDIGIEEVYKDMNKILNVKPIIYDGDNIPNIGTFDIIIFHWSIIFKQEKQGTMTEQEFDKRIYQLIKMTDTNGVWYISPKKHYEIVSKYFKNVKYFVI